MGYVNNGELLTKGKGLRTIDLEEVISARCRCQLLGVDDGLLESFALGNHFCNCV